MSNIKENVLRLIKEKGWSIVTTAKKAGLPLVTVKSVIYGISTKQRISTLEKFANAFGCTVNDLIADYDANNKTQDEEMDYKLFKESMDIVRSYLKKKKLVYNKDKTTKISDKIYSFLLRKKGKNFAYEADGETLEWILDNMK